MTVEVDARGLPCPQPVIRTRNAMAESGEVLVILDSETAQRNVTRMAEKAGARVEADVREGGIFLTVTPPAEVDAPGSERPQREAEDGGRGARGAPLVLVVPGEGMGRGEREELGHVLMRAFFHTLGEVEPLPETIIFFNSGVKLVVEDSPVVADLRALAEAGVEILACGTCLEYYGLKDVVAVGTVSNMYTIAETMMGAGRVTRL
jgi:selenium metabolism protein YedF